MFSFSMTGQAPDVSGTIRRFGPNAIGLLRHQRHRLRPKHLQCAHSCRCSRFVLLFVEAPTNRKVSADHRPGRGAGSNDDGRYERLSHADSHDGWDMPEDTGVLRTDIPEEMPRGAITCNRSPDVCRAADKQARQGGGFGRAGPGPGRRASPGDGRDVRAWARRHRRCHRYQRKTRPAWRRSGPASGGRPWAGFPAPCALRAGGPAWCRSTRR